jgi:hypothetical protein
MSKIGRNDPCPCGSGKKYKQCHLPIEQAAEAERRALRQAQDSLFPRLIEATERRPEIIAPALQLFWDGRYTPETLHTIEDDEPRGAERFLTWTLFDYRLPDGHTLLHTLADAPDELQPDERELQLLQSWQGVQLRPYVVEELLKGQFLRVRDMLDDAELRVVDHAASRRLVLGEVIVGHLVPIGDDHFIAGAAAHLTEDTRPKLREFAELHLEAFRQEHPDATWADMLRERSPVLNPFVMQLPTDEPNPNLLEEILVKTRVALTLSGEALRGRKAADDE